MRDTSFPPLVAAKKQKVRSGQYWILNPFDARQTGRTSAVIHHQAHQPHLEPCLPRPDTQAHQRQPLAIRKSLVALV